MASITVRRLDANGDPLHGNGQACFLSDLDAVAQIISTRLKLLKGEWWENLDAGTPLFQSLLGVSGSGKSPDAAALILTQRILGTPYVNSVSDVATSYNATTRAFRFTCNVQTAFGTVTVTNQNQPGSSASINQ